MPNHHLRAPSCDSDWEAYHRIRETVLWEARGRFGVYDRDHPDEHAAGHHPLLLEHEGEIVGVVRIDLLEDAAWLRRVAIAATAQGGGHGRALLELAAALARGHGATLLRSNVAEDAIGFYERCGWTRVEWLTMERHE